MIKGYKQFVNEASLRIPNSPEYWIKKLGKKGKDVMIYTHDDLDGIFSAIAIKKYFKDHGFNIIGYGLVSYQEGWKILTINPEVINVAVDYAEPHPDIDVYIDHHGEFVEGDKIAEEAKKKGAVKTKTGSAYEGIMDVLGLPVDSLVLSVIDMVDAAKYDTYGVKWTDLLDFNTTEIKKKPNAKLIFAGAFNQLLKRGEDATIIETIANVDEPSIYKIFDYMRRLYPGNNPELPRGTRPEDFSEEELKQMEKDFVADSKGRIEQMKTRTRGHGEFKGIITSQQEFKDKFTEHIEYAEKSRSKYAGQSADVIKLDGYVVIGEMAFLGSGTWANAIRARAIIQQDIESGRLPKEAGNIKWVLLQYGDTLQVCTYGNLDDYNETDLPTSPTGKLVDDLKVFCVDLLELLKNKIGFSNKETMAGGHKGIGSISNVGNATFNLPPDSKDYPYLGLRYIDILKNYMIGCLSKIKWDLNLSWDNPFSPEYIEQPIPMNAKVMMVNQIRKINKKTGAIEFPADFEKRPSLKQMRDNEARLKQLEKELNDQKMADHLAQNQAKHEYYRTHGEKDMSYEEWSKLNKEEQEKIEKERKTDTGEKPQRESKDYEKFCDFGCNYISTYLKNNPDIEEEEFAEYVGGHNKADRDSGELQDVNKEEIERLGKEFKKTKKVNEGRTISQEEARKDEEDEFKKPRQKDLEPYTYMVREPSDKVLAVGWLERGIDFPKGDVPDGFIQKLSKLETTCHTKGWHDCPFCGRAKGSCELTVTNNGITYRAPELIKHYVKEHNYQPPKEYIDAVMNSKEKKEPDFYRSMRRYK